MFQPSEPPGCPTGGYLLSFPVIDPLCTSGGAGVSAIQHSSPLLTGSLGSSAAQPPDPIRQSFVTFRVASSSWSICI